MAHAHAVDSEVVRRPHVISGEQIGSEVERRVLTQVLGRCEAARLAALEEIAYESIYAERLRLDAAGAAANVEADTDFNVSARRALAHADEDGLRQLLHRIVARYIEEIAGHFDPGVYDVATRLVPPALAALFGTEPPSAQELGTGDRVQLGGKIGAVQALAGIGTLILAPTHVSNLDSLLVATALRDLGLPPFAYGAGLNLFDNPLLAFFMRHVGAYTVDRKKADPLYRQTLKEYAMVLLERGQHSLFFPGGTRSRSGALERHLKKGLLGTAPAAFRHALRAGHPRPRIFVVPCTLSYPLVLEAPSLIAEYLHSEGGPHYVDARDESHRPRQWLGFLRGLRRHEQKVQIRFGAPLDWLGNPVEEDGSSRDPQGRPVDPARYLLADGVLVEDEARDAEYTRLCATELVAAYRRDTVPLATHVLAFVVFETLRQGHAGLDLFRFLRGMSPDAHVAVDQVLGGIARVRDELAALTRRGGIHGDELVERPAHRILAEALAVFGAFHPHPVLTRQGGAIGVGDPHLLLYYRNRLDGYGLLGTPALVGGGPVARGQS